MAGLVAFFDILGYQSFLQNNPGDESALETLKLINTLPKYAEQELVKQFTTQEAERGKIVGEIVTACKHLIFSDTIVVSLNYPPDVSKAWIKTALAYLTLYSSKLFLNMFLNGLPVRGAIAHGDFVSVEYCLAGKAVVDAYKLCESLDVASLVFHESLSEFQENIFTDVTHILIPYLTPINHSSSDPSLVNVNCWWFLDPQIRNSIRADTEMLVLKSFWGHKKECPLEVDSKIHNTVKLVRHFLLRIEAAEREGKK